MKLLAVSFLALSGDRRVVLPLSLGLLVLCLACVTAPARPPEPPAEPPGPAVLVPGRPVTGELAGREKREWLLPVGAGDYLRLRIDQKDIDVVASLLGPAGEILATADGPGGTRRPEVLPLISPAAGDLHLIVTARDPSAPPGQLRVELEELRPGRPGDSERVAAERAFVEGQHWRSAGEEEAKHKAIACFERALASWRAIADLPKEVETLNQIGAVYRFLGEPRRALALYEQSLRIALEAGDGLGEAETRNNLGLVWSQLGDGHKAIELYQEALRLWRAAGGSPNQEAVTLFNLGLAYREAGDPARALPCFTRALELHRLTGKLSSQALCLIQIGTGRAEEGDAPAALELLAQALEMARAAADPNAEAEALHNLAYIHLGRSELQKAVELYSEALGLFRRMGDRFQEGKMLSALGGTYVYLGDVDKALDCYNSALTIFTEVGNQAWRAFALRDIGWIHDTRQEPGIALEHYLQAEEISREIKNLPAEATTLHGLGRALIALGRPDEAIQRLEKAIALYEQTANAIGRIGALAELGRAWQAHGDLVRAADCLDRALALSRERKTLVAEALAQAAIARLEERRGRIPEAVRALDEALRIVESVRSRVASQRLRVSFFASRREDYELAVDLQMRLAERSPGLAHIEAALAASERARARALLDLLAEGRIDVRQWIAPELKRRETEIAERIVWLQTQLLDDLAGRSRGSSRAGSLEEELARAEEEREQLEWEIRREHPRYAAVRLPVPLPAARIRELPDEQTAFLEYSVGRDASFLFVITRGGLSAWRLPPAAELEDLVTAVRQGLQTPGRLSYARFVAAAQKLHGILIAPAAAVLRDKSQLIISPDGPLLLLPFETLLTGPPPQQSERLWGSLPYLILERSITYVPSASVLVELRDSRTAEPAPAPGSKQLVGFGDPAYKLNGAEAFVQEEAPAGPVVRALQRAGLPYPRRLPASRRELLNIAAFYPPAEVALYLDSDATEENVKENPLLSSAQRLHFAVHGFVNESHPELSGLMLAPGNGSRQDGLLQVYEIFNLQIQANLVVLSACDTALGQNVRGEGLIGVTRAFLYAGATSILVSLWQVADESTVDLMTRFYRDLDKTRDKAEALRRSKLELIRGQQYDHPFYWAPFVLIGDPRGEG